MDGGVLADSDALPYCGVVVGVWDGRGGGTREGGVVVRGREGVVGGVGRDIGLIYIDCSACLVICEAAVVVVVVVEISGVVWCGMCERVNV